MTLKCKIKELSEMSPSDQMKNFDAELSLGDGGRWIDLEKADEEVELRELGTIEQLSAERVAAKKERRRRIEMSKERARKERSFYDQGRLGYRPRTYDLPIQAQHPQVSSIKRSRQ